MATKVKTKTQPTKSAPADAGTEQQKLDDRTPIDDLKVKKGAKEKLPAGFKRRLPAGVKRTIKVDRNQLNGTKTDKPFVIYEGDKQVTKTNKIRVEGDSEMVTKKQKIARGCSIVSSTGAHMKTEASVLVGDE